MKIVIPQNQIAKQVNQGEMYGDFWASWNMDLYSSYGKIRVSPRPLINTNSANLATCVRPVAFMRNLAGSATVGVVPNSADTYFAICNQAILTITPTNLNSGNSFASDTIPNSPTTELSSLYSDAVSFNSNLIVSLNAGQGGNSGNATLAKLSAGVWTKDWYNSLSGSPTLTKNITHPLGVSFSNLLLIGNGNLIVSVDINNNVNTAAVTISTDYEIVWIRSSNTMVWIGARHKFGGIGKVFSWNGTDVGFTGDYKIGSDVTFAGVVKDEICYTLNGNGQLMKFNGGGFEEVARLPITNSKNDTLNEGLTTYAINVTRNGMALIDNDIHILLSAGIDATAYTFLENMLSGIWRYTPEAGLHHAYGISKSTDPSTITDYGSPLLSFSGALFGLTKSVTTPFKFLAGAESYIADSSGSPVSVINYINGDSKGKMGYFITPQLHTQEAEEMWQKVWLTFKKLKQNGDAIYLKYRTSINFRSTFDQTATWTSTSGFTCAATEFLAGATIGDEVEIMSGEGSGLSAQITGLNGSATVIDRTVTAATGAFRLRLSNWTKIDSVTDLVRTYKQFGLGTNSDWIQYKIVMYGSGSTTDETANSPEIQKLISLSTPQVKVV